MHESGNKREARPLNGIKDPKLEFTKYYKASLASDESKEVEIIGRALFGHLWVRHRFLSPKFGVCPLHGPKTRTCGDCCARLSNAGQS